MKNLLLLFVCCLSTSLLLAQEDFRKQAPTASAPPKVTMGAYQEFKLSNGLRVIVVENNKLPRVSFQLLVDLPMLDEGASAGLADMTGALIARGTKTRNKAAIDETIDQMGANFSSTASGLFSAGLSKYKAPLLELMADIALNPIFPETEFEKLKKQTLSGLASSQNDANTISANVSKALAFGQDHPYGKLTTEKTVDHIQLDECKGFHRYFYRPEISFLAMVGDIKLAEAKQLAEQYFGRWERGSVLRQAFDPPTLPEKRPVAFVNKPGAVQSVINITYPLQLKPGSPDAIPAIVLNTILGGYFSSRLNANIREQKGYSYGVNSTITPDKEVGSFNAGGAVRNEVTDSALVEFLFEMEKLRTQPVSDEELQMVKNVMTGSFARNLELPETVARLALNTARYGLPKDYYTNYLANLSKVTPQDIQEAARKYLQPDKAWIVVVGNKDIAPRLAKLAGSGQVDFYDYYGVSLDNNHTLMPEGVDAADIIENYLQGIGGRNELAKVNNLYLSMKAEIQGMVIESSTWKKMPGKIRQKVSMGNMVLNDIICDGQQLSVMAMGQQQPVDENMLSSFLQQAVIFPELNYAKGEYKLDFIGMETIRGKNAFTLQITTPEGEMTTEYFDMMSALKLRSVSTVQGTTITIDYDDYQSVKGQLLMPFTITTTGVMPVPMIMRLDKAAVNEGMDDALFIIKQ